MQKKVQHIAVLKDLKHDGDINLAFGASKTEKKWKNKPLKWSEFLARLANPTVTQETASEYTKMSKANKDAIKDVGGFVGGYLKEGRRKAGNVQSRSIVTLDADSGTLDLWDDIELVSDYAVAIYTTHSHTLEKPRYRIIIPLSRPVTVEEYEPLARMLANQFGMDLFDDTTYQPERLMFWPSHSRDGAYTFDYIDEKWLDPQTILDQYVDWKDTSYWPESTRGGTIRERQAKKQGDPLEKGGVIGAFCRTYDIKTALETFLSDVYVSTGKDDRYTYLEGSTSGGLVIYEDKFAYSHHGTDPVGDTLVNAFDLVRIHKFGHLDEDAEATTRSDRLPSFKGMTEFALQLSDVKAVLVGDKLKEAQDEFTEWSEEDSNWLAQLDLTKKGAIDATAKNVETIFLNDANLKQKVFMDRFANRIVVDKDLPWREVGSDRFWKDADDAGLRMYLEKTYGIVAKGKIDDALMQEIERNSVHPVREYLDTIEWDGVSRVETLLHDYLGAEDTEYTRLVTRKFLTAAVARIYVPGIKFDHMIVTTGPQGIGKTLLPNKLAGEWFSNSLEDVRGKDAYDALQGCWIMEMGEMTATKKADLEATKHFISKQEDIFRVAYGRYKSYFKRQCVFWGTSNDSEFLRDRTGNRRFWPVDVGVEPHEKKVWEMTDEDRNQIWAEAKYLFENGEKLYLTDEQEKLAKEQQDRHTESSSMEGEIAEYLDIPITEDWYEMTKQARREYIQSYGENIQLEGDIERTKISVVEIWNERYCGDTKNIHPVKASEIRNILANLVGWEKSRNNKGQMSLGPGYGRQVCYVKSL